MKESKAIDSFRRQFFRTRLEKVRTHGIQVFDEAALLIHDPVKDRDVLVTDTYPLERPHGSIQHFMAGLASSWWLPRQPTEDGSRTLQPRCGLYAHFLPQTNFDIVFEFIEGEETPRALWRLDARGRAEPLPPPKSDGDFRDQTGTFLDLRFGWRWLAETYAKERGLVAAEVETGYVIGLRPGVADSDLDPLERLDPAVEELADRYGRTRFDCVEILNADIADELPFAAEVFSHDLLRRYLPSESVEVFVLASSESFLAMVEEFADQDAVVATLIEEASETHLQLSLGPVAHRVAFAYPFLRTLYTARSFPDGVREFIAPLIRQVAVAHEIYERLCRLLADYTIEVDEFGVATISDSGTMQLARLNLFRASNQLWTNSSESESDLLKLVGLDPETKQPITKQASLDNCPICGLDTRVSKVIRPLYSIGDQAQRFAGLSTGQHLIYFVQECPVHTTPLELEPGRGLAELESLYQSKVATATISLLHAEPDLEQGLWFFVGYDAGSLILEAGRVTGLMAHFDISMDEVWGITFFADILILARAKPNAERLTQLRHRAREYVQSLFPDRLWTIDMVRPIDSTALPVGTVELSN